jgi:large subunit ribosomal protein L4e
MTSRPEISIWDPTTSTFTVSSKVALPAVFTAPIRLDIVNFVHFNLNRNRRQAHGVDPR